MLDPNKPTTAIWIAYRDAYVAAYQVEPPRNDKVNSQLRDVVKLVGAELAPPLAAWYVKHTRQRYTLAFHSLDMLVTDWSGLRTEYLREKNGLAPPPADPSKPLSLAERAALDEKRGAERYGRST